MAHLSNYLCLLFYFCFLFVYRDMLPANIPKQMLYNLSVYPASDWFSFIMSWCFQINIMSRRQLLMDYDVISVSQQKKEEDMFDVRYLPEEYLSDVQDESSDDE